MMKRFVLLAVVLLVCATAAHAQYVKVLGTAETSAKITTSGVVSTTTAAKTFPGATITILNSDNTNATIYSNATGTPKSNPYQASLTDATYDFFIRPGAVFSVRVSGSSGGVAISSFTRSLFTAPGTSGITGLVCGGSNDTSLLSAASALGGTIEITKGITCASNSQTISASLRVDNGGLLKPLTGQTVTLTGYPDIGNYQAFTNATGALGVISFAGNFHHLPEVHPDWWISDYSVDAQPAIQAANDAMPSIGGVIKLDGTYQIAHAISLGQFVTLRGNGHQSSELLALSTFSGTAMVKNQFPDSTQQIANVEGIFLDGNKANGAVVPIGILFMVLGQTSHIRDVTVNNCSGWGIVIDGGSLPGFGSAGYYLNNIWVAANATGQILVQGQIQAVTIDTATVEFMPAGTQGIYLNGTGGSEGHNGYWLHNTHMEGDPSVEQLNVIGIDINNVNSVMVDGVDYVGANATTGDLIKIRGTTSGFTLLNLRSQSLLNIINDTVNGFVKTVALNPRFQEYSIGGRYVGSGAAQSTSVFSARVAGNNLEFGNPGTGGFGSNIGNTLSSGFPFVVFNAENDATDTFRTRGIAGRGIIHNTTASELDIGRFTAAAGATQALTSDVRIDSSGKVIIPNGFQIGASGTSLTQAVVYTPSLTPSAVNANISAEQDFTVTGVTTADKLILNGPAPTAGTGIVNVRVKSANTVSITWGNFTAGSLTPTAGTYNIIAIRN